MRMKERNKRGQKPLASKTLFLIKGRRVSRLGSRAHLFLYSPPPRVP